jgi:hypothetical protein
MTPDKEVAEVVHIQPTVLTAEEKSGLSAQFDKRIAQATSIEEVFNAPSTLSLADVEGEEVEVTGWRFLPSSERYANSEGGVGYFVVMETDRGIITAGARSVVLKLAKAAELGATLPLVLTFHSSMSGNNRRVWDVSLIREG